MSAAARRGKVTVVGAGFYGSTTAQRLAEYDVFETVVLTDIVEGKPEGLALDLNQSRPIEGFETTVVGATTTADGGGYEATAGSDVVVITAGLPRKPGMSRMDLLEVNAKIVRGVAENIAEHSPNAVIIVVSNPLDEMTALAQLASDFPKNRVFGQAGVLDTARFTNNVATTLGVPVGSVTDADAGLARRHDGAGAVGVLRRRQAAGRRHGGRRDRGARHPHPQRRCRSGGAAQDRLGLLRPVGRGGPDGAGGHHRLAARSSRCARGSTASTASAASTSVSRPRSAPAA